MIKPNQESANRWVRPDGCLTLKEIQHLMLWFGVEVSFEGLRQTARVLRVPSTPGRGQGGRGVTAYYMVEALWMLATAYRRVALPRAKFDSMAKELRSRELHPCEPYTLAEFFEDEPTESARDFDAVRDAYIGFICHERDGLDIAVLSVVARDHWHECGLDDRRLAQALLVYKTKQLQRMGVPADVAAAVPLSGV